MITTKVKTTLLPRHQFRHSECLWWFHFTPDYHAADYVTYQTDSDGRVFRLNKFDTSKKLQVKNLPVTVPDKVLEVAFVLPGGKEQAVEKMTQKTMFLVGFDVWWKSKEKPSKGYVVQKSASSFFRELFLRVPEKCRTFNQVIISERTCELYFDVDVDGDGTYDLAGFIQLLFEAICAELKDTNLTPEKLWLNTVLLDASSSEKQKSSCHGICRCVVFPDNHESMKPFFRRVKTRLGLGESCPLDISVYSKYRCFRMFRNSKICQNRPLHVAPYNRYHDMPSDPLSLFLLTLVDQDKEVTHLPASVAPSASRKRRKLARNRGENIRISEGDPMLRFLLTQLQKWGNPKAKISTVKPCRYDDSKTYISFSEAHVASDHAHTNNNLYAVLCPRTMTVEWRCHKTECKKKLVEYLPLNL